MATATAGGGVAKSPHKNILMTPDPYHVPGYGGFCAQFKYQIGETFGRTTSRLLGDDKVASSGKLVLAKIIAPTQPHIDDLKDPGTEGRIGLINSRTESWGDQKLQSRMVPGYTGFIPKGQHHIGKRYAQHCVNSISNHVDCQDRHKKFLESLKQETVRQTRNNTVQSASQYMAFISKNTPQHTRSPYYMDNDNKDKYFISGYTGFVPRSRGLLGSGYPDITHTALNTFTDDTKKHQINQCQPPNLNREPYVAPKTTSLYPTDTGLVPHYTGHIPGEKYRYGDTFGHSTTGALQKRKVRFRNA